MKRKKAIRVILAALTLLMCAALCWAVWTLYTDGLSSRAASGFASAPLFTRESTLKKLMLLSPLFALWLGALIAAALTGSRAPARPVRDTEYALRLIEKNAASAPPEALREKRLRKIIRAACAGLCLGCAAWVMIWLLDRSHFVSWDLEAVLGETLLHILPPLLLGFLGMLAGARLNEKSREREQAAWKRVPRKETFSSAPMDAVSETPQRRAARIALFAAAAVLITLGVINGGLNDVLVKAINICTECIGLG